MIDELSNRITNYIKKNNTDISEEKAEIINYGMNILIYQFLIVLCIFAIALFLDLTGYIIAALVIFALLRIFAGGAHANSRLQCAIMNFAILFGTVIVSKYIRIESYIPAIIIYALNLLIVCIYAPGDTAERPVISRKLRIRKKVVSVLIVVSSFVFMIALNHDEVINNILLICPFLTLLVLTPLGYRLFKCKHSNEEVQTGY